MTTTLHRAGVTLVVVLYVGTIVTANWASFHGLGWYLGPLLVPAGALWAGCTLTVRDLLHDTLSPPTTLATIVAGIGLSWLLASPQIATASVLAFATSELLDTYVYTQLRDRSRLRAMVISNVAGLLVDSVLFVPLAFGSFAAVPGQLLGKTIATGLSVIVLLTVKACQRVARR
jgi:queuosine precursor transporter